MATSWVQVCNQALRELGVKKRIASPYEGSEVAKACLEVFGQTRDDLICSADNDWDFARCSNVALTLLKGPPPMGGYGPWARWTPAYPPPGWAYEYAYPADCLQFKAIVPPPNLYPILLPRPANWRVDEDAFDATGAPVAAYKMILSNQRSALSVYRKRITDMSLWDATFTEAMVAALADALAVPLGGNLDLKRGEQQTAAAAIMSADRTRGA